MSNFLFALIDGGGAVPPALSVAGALVRNGHDVRVLGDPVLRAEVEAVGARHIDWTTAPLRHERSKDADIVADWQARTPLGAMARTRDGFMVGPAAEYAQDTLDELARQPADAVVSEMLCMGAMLGGQAAGVPVAALITTVLPLPVPGRPPFGPGFMPARGPLGRARDAAVARLSSAMWNKALPKLNATRAQHGLPRLPARVRAAGGSRPHRGADQRGVRVPGWSAAAERAVRRPAPRRPRMGGGVDAAGRRGSAGTRRDELDLPGPCLDAAAGRDRARASFRFVVSSRRDRPWRRRTSTRRRT